MTDQEGGTAIREARRAAGLSLAGLADLVGVSQGTISQWERSNKSPSPEQFDALEHVLGLDDELQDEGSSDPHDPPEMNGDAIKQARSQRASASTGLSSTLKVRYDGAFVRDAGAVVVCTREPRLKQTRPGTPPQVPRRRPASARSLRATHMSTGLRGVQNT